DLTADEFVLAAGSWSSEVLRPLDCKLPLQGGKGYSFTVPNPPQLPRLCSILSEAHVAVTPMGSSLRIGGTMEFAGLDRSVSVRRTQAIAAAAAQYFPALRAQDIAQVRPWAGLRPCSPDGLPYIGGFAPYSNLCVAAGHAMLGISLAPITGQLVSQVLAGEQTRIALEPLSPRRDSWKRRYGESVDELEGCHSCDHDQPRRRRRRRSRRAGPSLRVADSQRLHRARLARLPP